MDHQKWQRSVVDISASPGRHGYGQSCRRKSHKTDQADRNGGCLMGEGRCWTCPTVRWTQRRAACRKNWSRSSHSRTVSWPPEHTPSQQPAPWRRFPGKDPPPHSHPPPSNAEVKSYMYLCTPVKGENWVWLYQRVMDSIFVVELDPVGVCLKLTSKRSPLTAVRTLATIGPFQVQFFC